MSEGHLPVGLPTPPGYHTVVPLDRRRHAGRAPDPASIAGFQARLTSVYVSVPELPLAALDYPVVFVADRSSGEYLPVALTALSPGTNLFAPDGRWAADRYQPAYVRRYPFCTVRVDHPEGAQTLVAVDADSLQPSSEPLFDAEGTATPAWEGWQHTIDQLEGAYESTLQLSRALRRQQLLFPFTVEAEGASGRRYRVPDLFRVERHKLERLPAKSLRDLARDGLLGPIYAHLLSLSRLARLLDLEERRH